MKWLAILRRTYLVSIALGVSCLLGAADPPKSAVLPNQPAAISEPSTPTASNPWSGLFPGGTDSAVRSAQSVLTFAAISLAPAAVLMLTAFVRISLVLNFLRQALGSPQVPGNQILTVLALLLTGVVMKPVADDVYQRGIAPYAEGRLSASDAWDAGTRPIKMFMIDQIYKTHHEHYLTALHERASGRAESSSTTSEVPVDASELPLSIVAPAFLLSELTTAFMIGFMIFLPFLVIDLVVSAVLSATGLFLLPPAQVAAPLKLVVFALAEGWWLVADMLLRTF